MKNRYLIRVKDAEYSFRERRGTRRTRKFPEPEHKDRAPVSPRIEPRLLIELFQEPRVSRVLELALRDKMIRFEFEQLCASGMEVKDAISQVAGTFFVSEETVRTVIYRKSFPKE